MTLNQYISSLLIENAKAKQKTYDEVFEAYTRYICDYTLNGESNRLYEEWQKAKEEYLEAVRKSNEWLNRHKGPSYE